MLIDAPCSKPWFTQSLINAVEAVQIEELGSSTPLYLRIQNFTDPG